MSTSANQKIALVTGGNRGIGLEVCRQLAQKGYKVLLGAREEAKGGKAATELNAEKLDVQFIPIDVANESSVQNAAQQIQKQHGKLHVLVNCAGIYLDQRESPLTATNIETVQKTLEVNTYGPLRTMKAFAPLLIASQEGRIVNVSSGMGQLSEMGGGSVGYRVSKTALNALTRIAHDELHTKHVKVNSACPGWVKTDMGGANAERSVAEGASGIVWLSTLPESGPSGGFFRDGKPIAW